VEKYGYGNRIKVTIADKEIDILPLAHPRQIGALGTHSEKWFLAHQQWENSINKA
jgi:hypothetical protein